MSDVDPPGRNRAGDTSDTLILPVGQHIDTLLDDAGVLVRQVRVGPRVHDLDEEVFRLWSMAQGGLRGPMDSAVEAMFDDGLLVEVEPRSRSAIDFARAYRVTPLMVGLGNSSDDPGRYRIGLLGRPVVEVDFVTYDLWQWSAMDETLWATCESAADLAQRAGSTDSERLDPAALLTLFLTGLQVLLTARAACVDVPFLIDRPDED